MAPSFAAPTSMPWESPRDTWVLTSHRQPASRVWALDTLPPAPRPRHDSGGKTALATPLPRAPSLVALSHGPIRVAPDVVVLGV